MNGLLVIDKPAGMTSREVVNRASKWFPRRTKIGHTGTLDPLATGVLVVCIGAATRLAHFVQAMSKSYTSRVRLGASSTTDDADGTVAENSNATPPARAAIEAALAGFIGTIEQYPPAFSALKLGGRRAHDLARRGRDVPLAARTVRIDALRLLDYAWPFLDVEIDCGKGTYIRSIARDLGKRLGVGGLMQTLRRTRVGPFAADCGIGLEATPEQAMFSMIPMIAALGNMVQVRIALEDEGRFRRGQAIECSPEWKLAEGNEVAILDESGGLIGVAQVNRELRPSIVLGR
jgi:tRNA pseudouridine55 synthase